MSATPSFGRARSIDPAWLAAAEPEEVLDPDLPIIDTAHHLYGPTAPPGTYLLEEYLHDLAGGHRVVASVYVECGSFFRPSGPEYLRPLGETEAVSGLAAIAESGAYGPTRVGAAIVGKVDLAHPDAGAALDAHLAIGGGRFRGVRDPAAYDSDPSVGNWSTSEGPGRYVSAEFRRGAQELFARGLTLDALVFFHQLHDVVDLAQAFPEGGIVLGHCGSPLGYGPYTDRDEVFRIWRTHMTELARCPNVRVKLGGMMIRLAAFDYLNSPRPATSTQLHRAWAPYLDTCLELFGPQRCMVESNLPIEKVGITPKALFNTLKRSVAGGSPAEKDAVLSGTALDFYRLDPDLLAGPASAEPN
ncbi:amidohydrolase family protein [Granulicoccus phenolivorans]|uniref:amidohydrolase family protein n=1 Tax=Granulicoccus phenolivorans TaxID=266854 RepID=UPI0003F890B2|nr:amidohydrolase family protein [Granulicoccus phenolivorans]